MKDLWELRETALKRSIEIQNNSINNLKLLKERGSKVVIPFGRKMAGYYDFVPREKEFNRLKEEKSQGNGLVAAIIDKNYIYN